MTDKLAELTQKREAAHSKLLSMKSRVYEAFLQMEEAAFSDGALPEKTKELIAVGISIQIDCESCMQWHIEQAAAGGATMKEVLEAVEIGIEMGGGPATGLGIHWPGAQGGVRHEDTTDHNLSRRRV